MTVVAPIVADSVRRDSEGLRVNQSDQGNVITTRGEGRVECLGVFLYAPHPQRLLFST